MNVGPFVLHERLGRGGMGVVHRAQHRGGEWVAVKLLNSERLNSATARSSFHREVRAMAGLSHPAILTILDTGETEDDVPWLAMELAGESLRQVAPTWEAIRAALTDMLDGLAHAHARGIIHRDLKPQNVLRSANDRRWKLADFGISDSVDRSQRGVQERAAGTPSYMAPEQIRGLWRDFGPWTDLYALGCVAWELVAGAPPWLHDDTSQIVQGHLYRPLPEPSVRVAVPEDFVDWMSVLLQKRPAHRFRFASDARAALEGLSGRLLDPVSLELAEPRDTWVMPAASSHPLETRETTAGDEDWLQRSTRPTARGTLRDDHAEEAAWFERRPAGLGLFGLRHIPLIGRERERAVLWQALREVHRRRTASVIVLSGAAGVGKSRLAEWLVTEAHLNGVEVFRAAYDSQRGVEEGLGALVSRHLRTGGLRRAEVAARTEAVLRRRRVLDPHLVEALVTLQRLDQPLEARERFSAVEMLVRTTERTAVMWLDDVQWGAEAVDFAAWARGRRVPLLVLLTARDEAVSPALRPRLQAVADQALHVGALDVDDQRALLGSLLGLSPVLAARIEERTAGNPLFAVHLVGDWVQRGLLQAREGGFELRAGADVALPDDLHALWTDHLDALSLTETDHRALEVAAALGQRVELSEWHAVCAQAPPSPALIPTLVRHRLAVQDESGWAFVHGMLRESLERRAVEAGRWADHNRACASALEAPARLGRHLVAAGDDEAALPLLLEGAFEADRTGDYAQGLALLDERLAALGRLGIPEDDRLWCRTWIEQGHLLRAIGRSDEALALAEQARDAAREAGWNDLLGLSFKLLAVVMVIRGRPLEGMDRYDSAVALLEAEGLEAAACEAAAGRLQVMRVTGEPVRAVQAYPDLVARQRALGRFRDAGATLLIAADCQRQLGDFDASEALFQEAHDVLAPLGDRRRVANALLGLGDARLRRGDAAGARAMYEQSRRLHELVGNPPGMSDAMNQLAELARATGDLDGAERGYREVIRINSDEWAGDAAIPRANLALVLLARGDVEEATALVDQAREDFEAQGRPGWVGAMLAVSLVGFVDDPDEFRARADRAEALLAQTGLADPDIRWSLAQAVERAEALGQSEVAARARSLEADQARRLGD